MLHARVAVMVGDSWIARPRSEGKYSFQGYLEIFKHWFDLDQEQIKDKLQFCKWLFQLNIESQAGKVLSIFPIPIGDAKETSETKFYPNDFTLKYQQYD